jgi:hypothetical protein
MKKILLPAIIIVFALSNVKAQNLFPDSGKVGIGTRSPAATLQISTSAGNLQFNPSATGVFQVFNSMGTLQFNPSGTTLYLNGPTPDATHMPKMFLGFTGDSNAAIALGAFQHDNAAISFDSQPSGGTWVSSHAGSNFSLYKANNELIVGFNKNTIAGSTFYFDLSTGVRFSNDGKLGIGGAAGTAKLYVNGNVGIGTNAPAYPLDVVGGIRATGNITVPTVNNIYIGYGGSGIVNSIALGTGVLGGANNTGSANVAIGATVLNAANMNGYQNVAVGTALLLSNTSGFGNTAIGTNSLGLNTTGAANVGIGVNALNSNVTGIGSVAIGTNVLSNATAGTNIAIGYHAGEFITTGAGNTFLGFYSTVNVNGSNNTIIGSSVSYNKIGITTGSGNTIVGGNISGLSPTLTNHIILADGLGNQRFIIDDTGNAGIGTSTPDAKLTVNGTVHAKEVKVNTNILPDYVFDKEYNLTSLKDVKAYIDKNHHLPEIPSAQQVAKDGLNLGEMNTRLLKKIEELTLYLIEKDTELKKQKTLLADQQKQLDEIKKKLNLN